MSDSAPIQQDAEPAPVQPEPEPQAPLVDDDPITDDPALNADIAATAIQVPDGEKLIPESKLRNVAISYRNKLKEAKQHANGDAELRQKLQDAQTQLNEVVPLAQAFRAIQQAQQQPQYAPQAPAEDTGRLEKIARTFDFYKGDGSPDLDRAREHVALVREEAGQISQQAIAPLVQHTMTGQAAQNVAKAKATTHPITGEKVPHAIIDQLVAQIAQQGHAGLATLADEASMKQIWMNAYSAMTLQPGYVPKGQPQTAAQPALERQASPPAFTERSGGQAPNHQRALSTSEKKAAKEAGLTEKAYLDMASKMPW